MMKPRIECWILLDLVSENDDSRERGRIEVLQSY